MPSIALVLRYKKSTHERKNIESCHLRKIIRKNKKKKENKRDLRAAARGIKEKKKERSQSLEELNSSSLFSCFYFFIGMYLMAKTSFDTALSLFLN